MSTKLYNILLVDYADYDFAGDLPYLFQKADCGVNAFCCEQSWLLKNSYTDSVILCNTKDPKEFSAELEKVVKVGNYDWVLLLDDFAIRIVSENITDENILGKILPINNLSNRQMLGSKAGFSVLCEKYDIKTPNYAIYDGSVAENIFTRKAVENIKFPILLKSNKSQGGKGVFLCNNQQDMIGIFSKLDTAEKNGLVFQQYIDGENIAVEALYRNGTLLAYAYSQVTKTLGGEFGISSERFYSAHPEIEPILSKVGNSFGVNGFASITFMRHGSTREYFLIELDPRPNGWFRVAPVVGVDFSQAIKSFMSEGNVFIRPKLAEGKDGIFAWHFYRDFIWCIRNRYIVGVFKWCINYQGRWRDVPWYDKRVLAAMLYRMLKYSNKLFTLIS